MTLSPAYRVCLEKLERVLSPRVASRSLHAGMDQADVTPRSATSAQLEPILKGAVFKQLQVAMPPDEARDYVKTIFRAMEEAEHPPAASPEAGATETNDPRDGFRTDAGPGTSDSRDPSAARERFPTDGAAPADPATRPNDDVPAGEAGAETVGSATSSIDPALYTALRDRARPFNLYFSWPEVRRLRSLLSRIQAIVEGSDDADADTLVAEVERSLDGVQQTLEDRLVLQAEELAALEEAFAELADVGGPKVRRLDNLIKRVREAQEDRQLADAEVERSQALARDLRKMIASSIYEDDAAGADAELEARIKALDVDAERAEIDRHARDRTILLDHRPDLAERVATARDRIASGTTLGDDLAALRTTLDQEWDRQVVALRRELGELEARLNEHDEAWTPELRREHGVLVDIVGDDALPPLADLVRFREQVDFALERLESADQRAEAASAEATARLDLQGDLLQRAQHELLRYGDRDDPGVERLRDGVEALRLAQAEETVDDEAASNVRDASEALARAEGDDRDPQARTRAQLVALIDRLAGLPAAMDPDGEAELRADLESNLDASLTEAQLDTLSAIVSDAIEAAHETARERLEALSYDAARWQMSDVLDAVRDANERLDDGGVPELGDLERRLTAEIDKARSAQLARFHELERNAERLQDIDEDLESVLHGALAGARDRVGRGEPVHDLDTIDHTVAELQEVLERRLGDVLPRLDAALSTLDTVERLNSDEVASARRILHHLDGQRVAFARVSPTLRARLERSLQEAEDLLAKLVEQEQATRAIADQLMTGSAFDDLLSGLDHGGAFAATPPSTDESAENEPGSDAERWISAYDARRDVVAAGLLPLAGDGRGSGFPAGSDTDWAARARTIVDRLDDLGRALDLGAPRIAAFEYDDGCLLLGHRAEGTAVLAGPEPDTLGLLVQELRDDAWRHAAATLQTDPTAASADVDHDGASRPE